MSTEILSNFRPLSEPGYSHMSPRLIQKPAHPSGADYLRNCWTFNVGLETEEWRLGRQRLIDGKPRNDKKGPLRNVSFIDYNLDEGRWKTSFRFFSLCHVYPPCWQREFFWLYVCSFRHTFPISFSWCPRPNHPLLDRAFPRHL
jgi:hypothetical protein